VITPLRVSEDYSGVSESPDTGLDIHTGSFQISCTWVQRSYWTCEASGEQCDHFSFATFAVQLCVLCGKGFENPVNWSYRIHSRLWTRTWTKTEPGANL